MNSDVKKKPLLVTRESIAAVNAEFGGIDIGGKMVAAGHWKISEKMIECQ